MPDLQSELSKVINEWEAPAPAQETKMPTHYFAPSNNVTRATFNYIRDNAGTTRVATIAALTKQGYKANSVSSIMTQMMRQGLVRETNGSVFAAQSEYTPLKSGKARQSFPAKRVVRPRTAAPAAKPTPTKAPTPAAPTTKLSAAQLLETLSIVQARELYDELKKIFGG